MNYLAGLAVVTTGIVLGLFVIDVNSILQWIVSGLYGGYVAANMLKWHWWRFNANGFFWGMLAGILPAIALAILKSFDVLQGLDSITGPYSSYCRWPARSSAPMPLHRQTSGP